MKITIKDLIRDDNGIVKFIVFIASVEKDVLDDNGNPVLDQEGNPVKKIIKQGTKLSLRHKDPSDPTFISYENITKEKALEFVDYALGEYKGEIEKTLTEQLNNVYNNQAEPVRISGVPW